MPNRVLVWTLAVLAVVLVVVPLLGAVGMMSVGWMGGGHMMMGMSAAGFVWTLLAAIVVIALIVLLISETSRT